MKEFIQNICLTLLKEYINASELIPSMPYINDKNRMIFHIKTYISRHISNILSDLKQIIKKSQYKQLLKLIDINNFDKYRFGNTFFTTAHINEFINNYVIIIDNINTNIYKDTIIYIIKNNNAFITKIIELCCINSITNIDELLNDHNQLLQNIIRNLDNELPYFFGYIMQQLNTNSNKIILILKQTDNDINKFNISISKDIFNIIVNILQNNLLNTQQKNTIDKKVMVKRIENNENILKDLAINESIEIDGWFLHSISHYGYSPYIYINGNVLHDETSSLDTIRTIHDNLYEKYCYNMEYHKHDIIRLSPEEWKQVYEDGEHIDKYNGVSAVRKHNNIFILYGNWSAYEEAAKKFKQDTKCEIFACNPSMTLLTHTAKKLYKKRLMKKL